MPVVGDQDVRHDVFFRDCSRVTVVATGRCFMGFFEYPEQITGFPPLNAMAPEVAARPTLRYTTGLAPPLSKGVLLEIEDQGRWEVRSAHLEQDGKVSCAELKRTN